MASITQGTDPLIAMPREFTSFFNNIEQQAGLQENTITNIEQFNEAIQIIIEKISQMNTEELPDEISKTNVTKFLQKKAMSEGGNGINMLGGIIMANICKKKLLEIADKADTMELSDLARARIVEIFNKTFVDAFAEQVPFREIDISVTRRGTQAQVQGNQKLAEEGKTAEAEDTGEDTGSGSYTQFFNNLFKLTNGRFKWRSEILAPVSNDFVFESYGIIKCY